jgi:myb proto-oncogene protein
MERRTETVFRSIATVVLSTSVYSTLEYVMMLYYDMWGRGWIVVDLTIAHKKSKWTVEEDAKLIHAVKEDGGNNWAAVAALVPSRSNALCRKGRIYSLYPDINSGKWTAEEDAKLTDAVTEFGNDWVRVAVRVPGRTNRQCRLRWITCLEPIDRMNTHNEGKWTMEEEAKLTEAATELRETNWVVVAEWVTGRTNTQCRRRWANRLDSARSINSAEEEHDASGDDGLDCRRL